MWMKKNKLSLSFTLSPSLSLLHEPHPQVPAGMSDLPPGYASRNTAADIQSNKDAVIPLSSPITSITPARSQLYTHPLLSRADVLPDAD